MGESHARRVAAAKEQHEIWEVPREKEIGKEDATCHCLGSTILRPLTEHIEVSNNSFSLVHRQA